jgi:PEP-CTERM motif
MTNIATFEIQVNDVPEPGSVALVSFGVAGLLGLFGISKRRNSKGSPLN